MMYYKRSAFPGLQMAFLLGLTTVAGHGKVVAAENNFAEMSSLAADDAENYGECPPEAPLSPQLEMGRSIYRMCATCHGKNGEGNPTYDAPRLQGQHPWYLIRQLQDFRMGYRGNNSDDKPGILMNGMSGVLATPEALDAVVAYIGTLPPPENKVAQ